MSRQFVGSLVFVAFVGFFVAMEIAARRHAARMRKEGKWDENGPLNPSPIPADEGYPSILGRIIVGWARFTRPRGRR